MCVQANGHRTGSTSASKLSDGYDWVPVETDTGWKQVCAACRAHGACKKIKKAYLSAGVDRETLDCLWLVIMVPP